MARYQNITGAEKIEKQLAGISRAAAEKIALALNKGADEIASRARVLAPQDTGRLKSELRTMSPFEATKRARGLRGVVGGRVNTGIAAGVTTGRAFYARFVEFGREARAAGAVYRDKRGRRRVSKGSNKSEAQPFFWPAYRSVRKRVRRRVATAVNRAAREVARG